MKAQLPPAAVAAILGVVVIAAVVLGMGWFNNMTGAAPEDPELAKKQWEVEKARTPQGEPVQPPSGFSPGRASEMEARQQAPQGGN